MKTPTRSAPASSMRERRSALTPSATVAPPSGPLIEEYTTTRSNTLSGWSVILWNDDVHSMDHVVIALVRTIELSIEQAIEVMYEAHENGKAVAWTGAKETAELYRDGLQSYGLTATISN